MGRQWFMWILIAIIGVSVLVILNYQDKKDSVSLSDIFPEQDKTAKKENIEYEFVDTPKSTVPSEAPAIAQPNLPTPQKPAGRQPPAVQSIAPALVVKAAKPQTANLVPATRTPNVFTPS